MEQKKDIKFVQGIVAALDVVAIYDYGTCFKEIIESAGKREVLREIELNGSERSKAMAKTEFKGWRGGT